MDRSIRVAALSFLIGVTLVDCASAGTKLVSSWHDPSAGSLRFKKVFVLCFAPHDSQRLFGEAELVRLMKKTHGVAAHTLMGAAEIKDEQRMREVMAREGFDGAVTLRLVASDQQFSEQGGVGYVPSSGGFWNDYVGAWPLVYGATNIRTDTRVQMETQVYSLKDGKLVWSGFSQSMNPDSAQQIVEGVAKAVAKELRKQHLID